MTQFATLCTVVKGKLKLFDRDGFDRGLRDFCDGEELELVLESAGERKTRKQEKGFHAMITPWAKELGVSIQDLKRDLLAEIFGLREHTDPLTGIVVMLLCEPHTSRLSKKKYDWLIERTLDIAARMGHILEAPSEYRERQAKARKRAAAA